MKLLIYGINYSPELTGIGKYSGEMATWLTDMGHQVDVLTAPPYYPEWKVHSGYNSWWFNRTPLNNGTLIRCPLYIPKIPSTLKRLIHLVSFSLSSGFTLLCKLFDKPDVVLTIQPTMFCAPLALFYARLTGAKAVMHIQDFEIDAMFGLGMMKHDLLARIVKKCECWLMRRFDIVSTISYSMIDNAKNKGVDETRLRFFPNWADIDFVTPTISGSTLKSEWGFNVDDKIVLYAGNIGKKQGLEIILEVADQLKANKQLHFVMVGTGAQVDVLKTDVTGRGLDNVHFKSLQPWKRVPEMLALADIHLVVQRKGAADVVLPSKLTNILSAGGHALVTAEMGTELGMLADRYPGIYRCIEPEDVTCFINELINLLDKDLSQPNLIARNYAIEFLSKENVLTHFENDIVTACQEV